VAKNLTISIHPIPGLPEIQPGDDLGGLIAEALASDNFTLADGDVVVVAQKAVSKAEGARADLSAIEPGPFATQWARRWGKDARLIELVLRESRRTVRMERGVLITETHHGFVCANSGVDLSNTGGGEWAILLPKDPDGSARALKQRLSQGTGPAGSPADGPADSPVELAVIVSDTFGRPWRVGLTQVALGVAGLEPLLDLRESPDVDGRTLHATVIAIADELASAADLVCGKTSRIPAAVIRGYRFTPGEDGGKALIRAPEMDLFR
jgi:coenzyme F420-0:L-glutamate ligase/coenzyme F420-1:gamma-L-glutamate ligase